MKRSISTIGLLAVISLLVSAIWHSPARAATVPTFASLGQIEEGLVAPARIDVDGNGNIFVVDTRAGGRGGSVLKYDKYGALVATFRSVSVTGSGIAVTVDGSQIYIAGKDIVHVLDGETGEVLRSLGSGAGEFGRAGAIDLDADGNVYVGDQFNRVVKVYDAQGTFSHEFGGGGCGTGIFLTLWTLAVDVQRGEVHVADPSNQGNSCYPRVQVFGLDGTLLRTLYADGGFGSSTELGSAEYVLGFFGGITFDESGRGYYIDSMREEFRVLGLPTTYLARFGTKGYDVGQFSGLTDAAYDSTTGRLLVIDALSRVGIYGVDGATNPDPPVLNAKPEVPVPLNPVDGSEVASATPDLNFANAADADGDSLTYDVRVFQGETLVEEQVGLPEGTDSSYANVATPLEENAEYQWTVQAFDGIEGSGWSAPESLVVNAVQEAPVAPALTAPLAGEALGGPDALSWQASTDPDPLDQVGYRVQIALDSAFDDLVIEEEVTNTAIALESLTDYAALTVGSTYFWRVVAVDEHGLEAPSATAGSFTYTSTVLTVTANMPGATVYLGGNYGYPGRALGTAPLELRDFETGTYAVVLERSGFEPFIVQVAVVEGTVTEVYAEMKPAIAPEDLKARPLQAGGIDIVLSGDAAPFVVDFDNDGLSDLLVTNAAGALTLYPGIEREGEAFALDAGSSLDVGAIPGASPFVVDWDNDDRKDLIVGGADGTLNLFLNSGTETAPSFGSGTWLQADGAPLTVAGDAVPVVVDLDGDGDKDLVVGSASGSVGLYDNVGTDASPQLASGRNLVALSSAVAPFFVDWNGDGERELMLAASEHLYRYERADADSPFAAVEVLAVRDNLVDKYDKSGDGSYALGDRLRLFACDLDGAKGKDLIVGNSSGEIRLVASHGKDFVAALVPALLEKVAQIDALIEDGSTAQNVVDQLAAEINNGDLVAAKTTAGDLLGLVEPGSEVAIATEELQNIL